MEFVDLARQRHSVRRYTPDVPITDGELRAIFDEVVLSPSSFNIQHWQFVVVRDPARKRELRGLSFGQQQVEQCSAAIVVCGRLDAHVDAPRIYADAPAAMREKFVPMIAGVYEGQPALQREEVIRSGALAAMSLMYAAKNRGWDSGPMIGFDAKKVAAFLDLGENVLPVMMVVVGKALDGEQPPRLYRRPVAEVVKLERHTGSALV